MVSTRFPTRSNIRNHGVPARSMASEIAMPSFFHQPSSASSTSRWGISGSLLCRKRRGERRASKPVISAHVRSATGARQAGPAWSETKPKTVVGDSSSSGDYSIIGFQEAEHESDSNLHSDLIHVWHDAGPTKDTACSCAADVFS